MRAQSGVLDEDCTTAGQEHALANLADVFELSGRRLLVTELDDGGRPSRTDRELTETELATTLAERFGIDLALG